jgi:6-pyruvoyltetrahydropterin/6-carboxytetrahydropterin synthase
MIYNNRKGEKMYTIAVNRDFVAQHYLVGGDWGKENKRHSHHYHVEVRLEGSDLNQQGFLVDIVEIASHLNEQVIYYKDKTLNDLAEFKGLNPSLERFAFIICRTLSDKINAPNVRALTVKIWENEIAWASYRLER